MGRYQSVDQQKKKLENAPLAQLEQFALQSKSNKPY
jgi:hypothetical protein